VVNGVVIVSKLLALLPLKSAKKESAVKKREPGSKTINIASFAI
jgi:hypothetical protein